MPIVLKSGNLNLLEPSGPVQACNGIALPFYLDGVLSRALDGKKRGITWRLKESLEDMEYVDDVCLVSHR